MPYTAEQVLRRLILFNTVAYLPSDFAYPGQGAGYDLEKAKFGSIINGDWLPGGTGTTCGYLPHFLLWAFNNRHALTVNRDDPAWNTGKTKDKQLIYKISKNIERLWADLGYGPPPGYIAISKPKSPFIYIPWNINNPSARPKMGDFVIIQTPGTNDAHVFVFLADYENGNKWLTADLGQYSDWGEKWRLANGKTKNPYSMGCFNYRTVTKSNNKLKFGTKEVIGWMNIMTVSGYLWSPGLPTVDPSVFNAVPKPWTQAELGSEGAARKLAQDTAWTLAGQEAMNLLSNWPYPVADAVGNEIYLWVYWVIYQTAVNLGLASAAVGGSSSDFLTMRSTDALTEMQRTLSTRDGSGLVIDARTLQQSFEMLQARQVAAARQTHTGPAEIDESRIETPEKIAAVAAELGTVPAPEAAE